MQAVWLPAEAERVLQSAPRRRYWTSTSPRRHPARILAQPCSPPACQAAGPKNIARCVRSCPRAAVAQRPTHPVAGAVRRSGRAIRRRGRPVHCNKRRRACPHRIRRSDHRSRRDANKLQRRERCVPSAARARHSTAGSGGVQKRRGERRMPVREGVGERQVRACGACRSPLDDGGNTGLERRAAPSATSASTAAASVCTGRARLNISPPRPPAFAQLAERRRRRIEVQRSRDSRAAGVPACAAAAERGKSPRAPQRVARASQSFRAAERSPLAALVAWFTLRRRW